MVLKITDELSERMAMEINLKRKGNNRPMQKKMDIEKFVIEYTAVYVSNKNEKDIVKIADAIMRTGVKEKDAYHAACAVMLKRNFYALLNVPHSFLGGAGM